MKPRDLEAARARAEATFKAGGTAATSPAQAERDAAERALREKTERLRDARLAQEALKQRGAEIRAERRRGR